MSDNLFVKDHAAGVVQGVEDTHDALQRAEDACKPRTHTTQYVGRQGPGRTRTYNVSCDFDRMWDICLHMADFLPRSLGRYAAGVGKGKAKTHASRQTYQKRELAYNVGAGRADSLARNRENLKYWIMRLISSKGETARNGIIQEIMEITESTHGLNIPVFMESPANLETMENAEKTISLMYSMFSIVSRDFKKFYLLPRIKGIRKIWNIAKPTKKAETLESLQNRIMAEMADKPEIPKKAVILERPHTRIRPHVSAARTAKELSDEAGKCEKGVITTPAVPKCSKPWLSTVHLVKSK